jgi:hypothetical protein
MVMPNVKSLGPLPTAHPAVDARHGPAGVQAGEQRQLGVLAQARGLMGEQA